MKHRKGIDLVRGDVGSNAGEGSARSDRSDDSGYRIEVWSAEPEAGGALIEVISRATDFSVSCASLDAALRARPGRVLVHINGRYRMSCERAPDSPRPESLRPSRERRRPISRWVSLKNGTSSGVGVLGAITWAG
mgnify:CR=1 FL=1